MNINYLTPQDIRDIHDVMLNRYDGLNGEYESGLIDYTAEKPALSVFGQDQYPDLFLKAAVYMYSFATNQYFCDGNKRTAYGCLSVFLEINGYTLKVDDDVLFDMAIHVANGKMNMEALQIWIAKYAIKL